jgi:glutathione peroxidase
MGKGAVIILLIITGIIIYFSKPSQMSFRQQLLQWVYPAIMHTGKLFGVKNKIQVNAMAHKPSRSLYDYGITLNDGSKISMNDFKGKKILVVNTASDCGYTAQYESLQRLYESNEGKVVVIAFPANDFKQQESADNAVIAAFCKKNYGVSFPLAKKTSVIKGVNQEPLFQWLTDSTLNGWCNQAPEWNFSKYLVDENGLLTHYFPAGISPLDKQVIQAIQ